jgi:hypothetical protein
MERATRGTQMRPEMADVVSDSSFSLAEDFSLTRGGPMHRLLVLLGNAGDERQRVIQRALGITLITWVPLFVLSLLHGDAYGTGVRLPFLRDFAVNVRFLIAAPILILAESPIDNRWRVLVVHFLKSGLVPEKELPAFEAAIEKTTRLRDRILPEVFMLLAAFLPVILLRTELLISSVSNWHVVGHNGDINPAGWWFNVVSTPIFRFLMFRWLWRMVLWTVFLWRVSRLDLFYVATHADLAAGLGFLSEGQKAFSPIVFAGGAVIAAQVANAIAYEGTTLSAEKLPMIAYGVIAILFLLAPLLVVTPVLVKVKRKGLREFGALVTRHNQLFDQKWIQQEKPAYEVMLGNPDASSLVDLGSGFTVIKQMGIVPIDKQTLVALALAAALPMIMVALYATPADDLIRLVLKMLG